MARNLSEHLLDMVETDPRFIGLSASAVLGWVKIIRLLDRNSKRRGDLPHYSAGWQEVRLHLHVSSDRLLTLMDIFQASGLLRYISGVGFLVPEDVLPIMYAQPHMKRILDRNREDEERFWRSQEGRRPLVESGDS